MNSNNIPQKHFQQFLSEISFRGPLDAIPKNELERQIKELQTEIFKTQPGDMIALYTKKGFMPYYGLVELVHKKSKKDPTDENLIVIVFETDVNIQRTTITESEINDENTVMMIPASRQWIFKTREILQNSKIAESHKFSRNPKGISYHIIGELESSALHLACKLNLPLPIENKTKEEIEKTKEVLAKLPGRNTDIFDDYRGYCGWGPFEDYAITKEIQTYSEFIEFLNYENYRILDFYFKFDSEQTQCPYCAGSGINRDYAELHENFYDHNPGRWKGWGQKLEQDEVDYLVKEDRLTDLKRVYGEDVPVEMVNALYRATAAEQKRIAGIVWMGHDAIDVYLLTKMRAKKLGISLDKCSHCDGGGYVNLTQPKLSLACWIGAPEEEIDIIVDLKEVPIEQLTYFKGIVKNHANKMFNHLNDLKEKRSLLTSHNLIRETSKTNGWNSDMVYDNWDHFETEFKGRDFDLNVAMGYAFYPHPDEKVIEEIPNGPMNIFMARPRKGCIATARIKNVSEKDRSKMIKFFENDIKTHQRHFNWALD